MLIETQRIAQKLGRIQSPPSGTKEELEGQRHEMSHKNAKRFNPLRAERLWSWRASNTKCCKKNSEGFNPLRAERLWSWRASNTKCCKKNSEGFNPLRAERLWSWRGLNPRPNREIPSFLHAYPSLSFRAKTRPGPQANALSPEDVTLGAGPPRVSPVVAAPPFRRVTGRVPPGDVSFQHLVPE